MYREELLRWGLIAALSAWALTATIALAMKSDRTILIGVSDDSSYLIEATNLSIQRKELGSFAKTFVDFYYSFDENSYETRLSRAGDLMSSDLWELKSQEFQKMKAALAKDPLSQTAMVLSIDESATNFVEALVAIRIHRKLESRTAKLKVSIKVTPRERTPENPWPYEVVEITDATL